MRRAAAQITLWLAMAAAAHAQSASTQQFIDSLYGQRLRAVEQTPLTTDDVTLAGDLLEAATQSVATPDVAVRLGEIAYDLAAKEAAGYDTAVKSLMLIGHLAPDRRIECLQKALPLRQRQFLASRPAEKAAAGERLIDVLLAAADLHAQVEDVKDDVTALRRAINVASGINSPRLAELRERLDASVERQRQVSRGAMLKRRLDAEPGNAALAAELAQLYLIELQDTAAAMALADRLDAALKSRVQLAAQPLATLTPEQALEMGDFYRTAAMTSSPAGKLHALQSANLCYQQFLWKHTVADLARTKGELLLKQVQDQLAALASSPQTLADHAAATKRDPVTVEVLGTHHRAAPLVTQVQVAPGDLLRLVPNNDDRWRGSPRSNPVNWRGYPADKRWMNMHHRVGDSEPEPVDPDAVVAVNQAGVITFFAEDPVNPADNSGSIRVTMHWLTEQEASQLKQPRPPVTVRVPDSARGNNPFVSDVEIKQGEYIRLIPNEDDRWSAGTGPQANVPTGWRGYDGDGTQMGLSYRIGDGAARRVRPDQPIRAESTGKLKFTPNVGGPVPRNPGSIRVTVQWLSEQEAMQMLQRRVPATVTLRAEQNAKAPLLSGIHLQRGERVRLVPAPQDRWRGSRGDPLVDWRGYPNRDDDSMAMRYQIGDGEALPVDPANVLTIAEPGELILFTNDKTARDNFGKIDVTVHWLSQQEATQLAGQRPAPPPPTTPSSPPPTAATDPRNPPAPPSPASPTEIGKGRTFFGIPID